MDATCAFSDLFLNFELMYGTIIFGFGGVD